MHDSRILVRTTTTLRNQFKAFADEQDMSMSELIREFIESKVDGTS